LAWPAYRKAIQQLESEKKVMILSYDKLRRLTKDGLSVPEDAILLFSGGGEDGIKDAD
jgi:hypothetical protein